MPVGFYAECDNCGFITPAERNVTVPEKWGVVRRIDHETAGHAEILVCPTCLGATDRALNDARKAAA